MATATQVVYVATVSSKVLRDSTISITSQQAATGTFLTIDRITRPQQRIGESPHVTECPAGKECRAPSH